MLNDSKGFTLIEFCIVIAIMVIALAVAVSAGMRTLPDHRLKTGAKNLHLAMQEAKMMAVRNNTEYAIWFNPAQNSYQILRDPGPDGTWGTADDIPQRPAVSLPDYGSGVGYGWGNATTPQGGSFGGNGITYNNNIVIFNSRGMLLNAGTVGYVYLSNSEGSSYSIGTPTLTGNIVTEKWYNNGVWGAN